MAKQLNYSLDKYQSFKLWPIKLDLLFSVSIPPVPSLKLSKSWLILVS